MMKTTLVGLGLFVFAASLEAAQVVERALVGWWQVMPASTDLFYEIAADGTCVIYLHGQIQPGPCRFEASNRRWKLATSSGGTTEGDYLLRATGILVLTSQHGSTTWKRVPREALPAHGAFDAVAAYRLSPQGEVPGEVTSVSAEQLIIVTDRSMSIHLKQGTALTFDVTPDTEVVDQTGVLESELPAGERLMPTAIPRGALVTVHYFARSGRVIATKVRVRPESLR